MWAQFKRVIKPKGAIVLTASQPFTSALVMSNIAMFKYSLVWEKDNGTNYLLTPFQPMKVHEDICVFAQMSSSYSRAGTMAYFPQKTVAVPYTRNGDATREKPGKLPYHAAVMNQSVINIGERHPRSVMRFETEKSLHPTQKPVALFEYLIRTYTQPGDVVLDPCVGSGTTAIAARNTDRHFICGDSSAEYVAIARKRLQDTDPYQSTEVKPGFVQQSLFSVLDKK